MCNAYNCIGCTLTCDKMDVRHWYQSIVFYACQPPQPVEEKIHDTKYKNSVEKIIPIKNITRQSNHRPEVFKVRKVIK